jgi:hypothetical protein
VMKPCISYSVFNSSKEMEACTCRDERDNRLRAEMTNRFQTVFGQTTGW